MRLLLVLLAFVICVFAQTPEQLEKDLLAEVRKLAAALNEQPQGRESEKEALQSTEKLLTELKNAIETKYPEIKKEEGGVANDMKKVQERVSNELEGLKAGVAHMEKEATNKLESGMKNLKEKAANKLEAEKNKLESGMKNLKEKAENKAEGAMKSLKEDFERLDVVDQPTHDPSVFFVLTMFVLFGGLLSFLTYIIFIEPNYKFSWPDTNKLYTTLSEKRSLLKPMYFENKENSYYQQNEFAA